MGVARLFTRVAFPPARRHALEEPVPNGIQKAIASGRYKEAATTLTRLAAEQPSLPVLVTLASVDLQLGDLAAAKRQALKAAEASPRDSEARCWRDPRGPGSARGHAEPFHTALELATPPPRPGRHRRALHTA